MNPYKLYRRSYDWQIQWIRNHPVQYVAYNAAGIAVIIGYYYLQERKTLRKRAEFLASIKES